MVDFCTHLQHMGSNLQPCGHKYHICSQNEQMWYFTVLFGPLWFDYCDYDYDHKSHNHLDLQGTLADARLNRSQFLTVLSLDLCLGDSQIIPSSSCSFHRAMENGLHQPWWSSWSFLPGDLHMDLCVLVSSFTLPHWSHGLCSWCPGSFRSIVFPWSEFSTPARLWVSMFHMQKVEEDWDDCCMHEPELRSETDVLVLARFLLWFLVLTCSEILWGFIWSSVWFSLGWLPFHIWKTSCPSVSPGPSGLVLLLPACRFSPQNGDWCCCRSSDADCSCVVLCVGDRKQPWGVPSVVRLCDFYYIQTRKTLWEHLCILGLYTSKLV